MLNDGAGASAYTYDSANRLKSVTQDANSFAYNGLGDRVSQTVNSTTTRYTLDLNAGLTQVLADGTNTYLYGVNRIGEQQPGGFAYHLPDALGSVRQLVNASGAVTLAKSYEPYGSALSNAGSGTTNYNFTGEWADASGLVHLRAREYVPGTGRFLTRDVWEGDANRPMSYNAWLYGYSDPIRYTDPSGNIPCSMLPPGDREEVCPSEELYPLYGITFTSERGMTWLSRDKSSVISGVKQVALALSRTSAYLGRPMPSFEVFRKIFGPVNYYFTSKSAGYYCERLDTASGLAPGTICYKNSQGKLSPQLIAHELGHVFNAVFTNKISAGTLPQGTVTPYNALYHEGIYVWQDGTRKHVAGVGNCVEWRDENSDGINDKGECANYYNRTDLGYALNTQHDTAPTQMEDFADMFVNWAYNSFDYQNQVQAPYASARYNWMNAHMREWVRVLIGIPESPPPPFRDDGC